LVFTRCGAHSKRVRVMSRSGNVPRYVHRETTRHGRVVYYFRIGDGPRIRMMGAKGSAEFKNAYAQAVIYYTMLRG
jgi:hypothetical protein